MRNILETITAQMFRKYAQKLDNATKEELASFVSRQSVIDTLKRTGIDVYPHEITEMEEQLRRMTYRKVVLVGRHDPAMIPMYIDIVLVENILWPLDFKECTNRLWELFERAKLEKCDILFQSIPGILHVAISHCLNQFQGQGLPVTTGVMISKVTTRLSNVETRIHVSSREEYSAVTRAIEAVNSRANVSFDGDVFDGDVVIENDPIPAFELDHIEWSNK